MDKSLNGYGHWGFAYSGGVFTWRKSVTNPARLLDDFRLEFFPETERQRTLFGTGGFLAARWEAEAS